MSDSEQCLNWLQLDIILIWVNVSCELVHIMTRYDLSDFERYLKWLQLNLISFLVNFSYELGQILTRYDFLYARWLILSNVWTNANFA